LSRVGVLINPNVDITRLYVEESEAAAAQQRVRRSPDWGSPGGLPMCVNSREILDEAVD